MSQKQNTFVEELEKLQKNLQALKWMPGAEQHFQWVILTLEAPIVAKLQELNGIGGQFPGQPPGSGNGATGPTGQPGAPALGAGMPPAGGPPMMPGGMPPGMIPPGGGGPTPLPGPIPTPTGPSALPEIPPDMLRNLRGG